MTIQEPVLAIDAVCNLHTPETVARRGPASLILDKIRASGETATGISIERLLQKMDTAGIERTFLIAAGVGLRSRLNTRRPLTCPTDRSKSSPMSNSLRFAR